MATTTPNFGWPVPTSTDLVKDGATAIEALGDSIDASLLDLKGGTTGQVLSKNSNTDMDFTWVAQDDSNAIQNTIVDAKGDLIAATAADTPARLAVGTNGQVLTADSTTATGLKWATAGGGGKVLQVVSAVYSTDTTTASTTFADTGLTASITPTSATSRILVLVSQQIQVNTTSGAQSAGGGVRLLRGSTSIFNDTADYQTSYIGDFSSVTLLMTSYTNIMYVDSPATTSATTYKTQQRAYSTTAGGRIRSQVGGQSSTITLLEIGA
jgi:hypothetical protein